MSATDRRSLLRLAAAALILPVVSAGPARAAAPGRFAPPGEPMRYSRRLERGLDDGASFVVTRSFAVRFLPQGRGFLVEGGQIAVDVAAPDKLAEFARLERERIEEGVFPLLLAADGSIAAAASRPPLGARLDEAVREALARIEGQHLAPGERAELVEFVGSVHRNAGMVASQLPRDLFAPGDVPRSESRTVALPDGGTGHVSVLFSAERDPETGLMRAARREVVTDLAGDRRFTEESWRLAPL